MIRQIRCMHHCTGYIHNIKHKTKCWKSALTLSNLFARILQKVFFTLKLQPPTPTSHSHALEDSDSEVTGSEVYKDITIELTNPFPLSFIVCTYVLCVLYVCTTYGQLHITYCQSMSIAKTKLNEITGCRAGAAYISATEYISSKQQKLIKDSYKI